MRISFQDKLAMISQPKFDEAIHDLLDVLNGEEVEGLAAADVSMAEADPTAFLAARGVEVPEGLTLQAVDTRIEGSVNQIECVGACCICAKKGDWQVCA